MKHGKHNYNGKYLEDYDADFLRWSFRNLPRPKDYFIQDVDALIRSRAGDLQLVEIKRKGFGPKPYQLRNMRILDAIIRHYFDTTDGRVTIEINGRQETHKLAYHGFNLVQLSKTSFSDPDNTFYWNGEAVTSGTLADRLSFSDCCESVTDPVGFY